MQEGTPVRLYTPHTPVTTTDSHTEQVSTEYARARAREGDPSEVMAYAAAGGLRATPGMLAYIGQLMRQGMSKDVLLDVITQTFMAPRPSWHYFAAICRRLLAAGVRDLAALEADRAAHAGAQQGAPTAPAGGSAPQGPGPQYQPRRPVAGVQYTQRQYAPGELDELCFTHPDDLNPDPAPAPAPRPARPPALRPCKEVGAHRFSQREYTDEELDKLLFSDLDDLQP